jgi:hypothetical protein
MSHDTLPGFNPESVSGVKKRALAHSTIVRAQHFLDPLRPNITGGFATRPMRMVMSLAAKSGDAIAMQAGENAVALPDILDGNRFPHHLHFKKVRIVNCDIDLSI